MKPTEEISETSFICPYCGESDGEPQTVYSREFQGDEGHGGMVEHADEMCSLCIREQKYRSAMLDNLGYVPEPIDYDDDLDERLQREV